jgi:quinol monooxygenase YgiN
MTRVFALLALLTASTAFAQAPQTAAATPDSTFYNVSYVEVAQASRTTAVATLKKYRDANRQLAGYVRFELFEQVGRPGHFVIVETWQDQKASEAHAPGQMPVQEMLQSIRVSGYDQRPYKTLTVGPPPTASASRATVVVTHVDVSPDPRVPAMLKRLAEASRREEGNLRFDVYQHTMRANHFTIVEAWQSDKALEAHAGAAHTKQYRDELQPMTGSPLDERVYKTVE